MACGLSYTLSTIQYWAVFLEWDPTRALAHALARTHARALQQTLPAQFAEVTVPPTQTIRHHNTSLYYRVKLFLPHYTTYLTNCSVTLFGRWLEDGSSSRPGPCCVLHPHTVRDVDYTLAYARRPFIARNSPVLLSDKVLFWISESRSGQYDSDPFWHFNTEHV